MVNQKNNKRVILRDYFKITGVSEFTAVVPVRVDLDYGLSNVVLTFSNSATKTLNVVMNFLFEAPANDFHSKNNILLAGDLLLNNIPVNTGTVINMDYVFDTEEEFLAFESNFITDNSIEIDFK